MHVMYFAIVEGIDDDSIMPYFNKMQAIFHKMHVITLEIPFLFDDIERPTDHFFMDIGDIDTDETQRHEYDSYHDRVDDDDDSDIGESVVSDPELVDKLEK